MKHEQDPEVAHAESIADIDTALNTWNRRTASCRDCTRTNGLRRLCASCRASMPQAPAGLKAQRRAGDLVGRKMSAGTQRAPKA